MQEIHQARGRIRQLRIEPFGVDVPSEAELHVLYAPARIRAARKTFKSSTANSPAKQLSFVAIEELPD